MNDLIRPLILEAPDRANWKQKQIKISVNDENANKVTSICNAEISSLPQSYHNISFILTTKAYLPVEIDVSVFSSADSELTLLIDGKQVNTFNIKAIDIENPEITFINQEVTLWTEKHQQAKLELRFASEKEQTVGVIIDSPEPSLMPRVTQKWNSNYFIKAILFFVFINASILGLGMLIAVHLRGIDASLQFYIALITAIVWLLSVLGLTDLLKIPFQQKIRLLYSKANPSRSMWLVGLGALFLIIFTGVGLVVYSIEKRQSYTTLVKRALSDSSNPDLPIKAFKMMPWRKDSQLLIEGYIRSLRNSDMNAYRAYVKNFTEDPEVIEVLKAASNNENLPFYLIKDDRTLSNPIVWFAGLMVDKEDNNKTAAREEAIKMLYGHEDYDSTVQRLKFELSNLTSDLASKPKEKELTYEKIKQNAETLENLVQKINQSGNLKLKNNFYYQLAHDTIALSYANLCVNSPDKTQHSKKIFDSFKEEASSRYNALSSDPLWIRPPEKLVLYHLFTIDNNPLIGKESQEGRNTAEGTKQLIKYCYCEGRSDWKNEQCYEDGMKKEVINEFKDFQERSTWLKGTSSIENLKIAENSLLQSGWRY